MPCGASGNLISKSLEINKDQGEREREREREIGGRRRTLRH